MTSRRPLLISLAAAALAFPIRSAAAQSADGFQLDRFDPSDRGSRWFVLDDLDLRGHMRPAVGVVGDWSYKPLVLYDGAGSERAAIVKQQLFAHLGASMVLWDRVRFGLNAPLVLVKEGEDGTAAGITYPAPTGGVLGDVRLSGDVRLLSLPARALTVAAGLRVYLPSGDTAAYAGDGKLRIRPQGSVAGEAGPISWAGRLSFEYRAQSGSIGGGQVGSEMQFAASGGLRALNDKLLVGPELWGSTVVEGDGFFAKKSTPFEVILGGHYDFARSWRAGAGVGPGLTRGFGAPAVRVVASLEWAPAYEEPKPPPPDRDKDGVADAEDACPDVKGVRTSDPKTNGCPADRDADAIVDSEDACPDVKGVKTSDPKTNGCPPPADRDEDGIVDAEDACPDVKGEKTDDPKTNGCPPPPPDPDRDKDGIVNEQDACPDQAGAADPDPKKNGCPAAAIVGDEIKILEQVKFKTASAAILPESTTILEAVRKLMATLPESKHFRVEGHTDNRGGAALNRNLSKQRAASVVTWLVKHGVAKDRLVAQGFGPDRPIDTNDTEEGRKNNRRVEFHIVDGDAAPAPEKPAQPAKPAKPAAPKAPAPKKK